MKITVINIRVGITNSVGAPNGAAQKDVKTSLSWMGVSKIYTCGAGMMGDIFYDKMTISHKEMLKKKMYKLAEKAEKTRPSKRKSLKGWITVGGKKLLKK